MAPPGKICVHGMRPKHKCATCKAAYLKAYRERTNQRAKDRERYAVRAVDPTFRQKALAYSRRPDNRRKAWERMIRKYGITPEDVARQYERQDRRCAGCRIALDLGWDTHIDHDHVTGVFRGLLCRICNPVLGRLKDSAETLERLAQYLRGSRKLRIVSWR